MPCRLDGDEVGRLRSQARDAGASFIVLCGVHKMSTLVMAMKVDVFEVGSGRLVTSKLLSFRGDNDEGWRRAGVFVAQEVAEAIAKPRMRRRSSCLHTWRHPGRRRSRRAGIVGSP